MKAILIPEYSIPDYGNITFLPSAGKTHRVIWRSLLSGNVGRQIGWLKSDQKPSRKLAIFFCELGCAEDDGLNRYHYCDKKIIPPPRQKL
jgi:hypothetical protein